MSSILTVPEAALFVRSEETDPILNMLLPQTDAFIQRATGRDWTADTQINELAKAAAGMLLVLWYDNPAQAGTDGIMPFGLTNVLSQLEAEALKYRKYTFEGLSTAGALTLPGALEGDTIVKLVGVYGVSGDQTAKFETAISEENQITQTYGGDLAEKHFVVILKSPAEDITA
jgi:hypothetical protein